MAPSLVLSFALFFQGKVLVAQTGHTISASSMTFSCPIAMVGNGIRLKITKERNYVSVFSLGLARKKGGKKEEEGGGRRRKEEEGGGRTL